MVKECSLHGIYPSFKQLDEKEYTLRKRGLCSVIFPMMNLSLGVSMTRSKGLGMLSCLMKWVIIASIALPCMHQSNLFWASICINLMRYCLQARSTLSCTLANISITRRWIAGSFFFSISFFLTYSRAFCFLGLANRRRMLPGSSFNW